MTPEDVPPYSELILPVVRAVDELGGSAKAAEIVDRVLVDLSPPDEALAVMFENRPHQSVYIDRIMWARSYAKLIGALESPKRAVFLLTPLGKELLVLPAEDARARVLALDREFRRNRTLQRKAKSIPALQPVVVEVDLEESDEADVESAAAEAVEAPGIGWRDVLLERLHHLSPDGFEDFVLYLLRLYGMELTRVGGPGDGGIDGIGTAPISPVLASRVAVQVKRFDPNGRAVSRDEVALFQRDAKANGAERAVFVSLGRFSEKARAEAIAMSPTVDLIDGDKLVELVLEQRVGVKLAPVVDPAWFDRFD